ncbi:MAG: glycosyltransferase [Verrucomicrobiota bacterium]
MEKPSGIYVSVCIVNWNTCGPLATCLKFLGAASLPADLEVIVVDNASTDDSVTMVRRDFPQVKLLPQTVNLMFGPGMNAAAAHASGKYILLLNSDTEVTPAQVRALADFLEASPNVGACSPREKDANGKLWSLRAKPPTAGRLLLQALGGRSLLRRGISENGPQESLTGSCMMIRADVGRKVGFFDPLYPFYYEDTDLLTKIREEGLELRVVPAVVTMHRHATSSSNVDRGRRLLWITRGFCRFVWKHRSPLSARLTIGVELVTSLFETVFYSLAALLTLGRAKKLWQRARVGPQVSWILFRALWFRPFDEDRRQIEIIVTNLKRRHSGVSSTVFALLPAQRKLHRLAYWGKDQPPREYSMGWWAAFTTSFAARPPGRKFRVWHVRRDHEMIIALLVRWLTRGKIKILFTSAAQRFHGRFVRWVTAKMDAVVATTSAAATFCPKVKAVIGHGVDCEKFHPPADRAALWRQAGLPGTIGIGVFGRVREEKGVDIFVEAMLRVLPEFPDATALVVGECLALNQPFKDRLIRKIRDAGLEQRFVWTGYIPNHEVGVWYQRSAIAVACPRYEGYGLTLLEAAASGCAVIGSNTGVFPLLIEDGRTGFLTPAGDVESLSRALRTLLADPERRHKLAEAVREKVRRDFSVEREARELAKVYDDLLGAGPKDS